MGRGAVRLVWVHCALQSSRLSRLVSANVHVTLKVSVRWAISFEAMKPSRRQGVSQVIASSVSRSIEVWELGRDMTEVRLESKMK